ncbi:hypothetical protein DRP07_08020 [Archaeoglobales archaeon]|nr:MAG: hypothetical protein DRP07_08020 [Archaeoglobales archaeon]
MTKNEKNEDKIKRKEMRDHLFISYATEDFVLAEWLTLRLTSEGYRVWCDRFKLLGGESYPKDIDKALKERTFRVLALLSRNSIKKDNPVKERTMALNIGKELGIRDFLIPLNVDGLSSTELDWMTGDITYIPFYKSWADGFYRLLKKLKSVNAPCPLKNGRKIVADAYLSSTPLRQESETIYSNCIKVKRIPDKLLHLHFREELSNHEREVLRDRWPFFIKDNHQVFAFTHPPELETLQYDEIENIEWRSHEKIHGIPTDNIIKNLLKKALEVKCLQKGLIRSEVGRIYFPRGLFKNDNLVFKSYTGRKSHFKVVGTRRSPYPFRYHLSPSFKIKKVDNDFIAQISINFYITDLVGLPVDSRKASTRHKALRKTLFNNDFLIRCIGICDYLSNNNMEIVIGENDDQVVFDARLVSLTSPFSIDESRVEKIPIEDLPSFEEDEDFEDESEIEFELESEEGVKNK